MIDIGVLGPVEVRRDGQVVSLSGLERGLIAVLALSPGDVVSSAAIIDALWGEKPPSSARNRVQALVSGLRRKLGSAVATRAPGYALDASLSHIDLVAFQQQLTSARAAAAEGRTSEAATDFHAALALWRGPALGGAPSPLVDSEEPRLRELHVAAVEDRVEVDLALGHASDLVPELTAAVRRDPLRERLRGQLMLALYRSGRQSEALDAFRLFRDQLADELGVDPGPALQELHTAILRNEAGLAVSPPVAVPAGPAELPATVTDFTGRSAELDELNALASGDPTAVLITAIAGTGGVGKTALAVHWGHQVAARFPDGQLFVNLRGYDLAQPLRPIDALAGFLRALGVPPEQVPTEEEPAAALYRSRLAGKRVLIVLDNARTPDQVRPLLPGEPGCLTVVTSRDRLTGLIARDGARRLTLDVLPHDEALALLATILGSARIAAEPAAAAELAAACDHLPLALRIAAANLADQPNRSIAEHVAALRTDRLTALAVDGDERSAIRAVFDQSYNALDPEAQRLFRLLGLIPGPDFTPEATAALANVSPATAAVTLHVLVSAHLIDEHLPDRFTLHDLLKQYAAEQNELIGGEDNALRLYDWYLSTADAAARALYPNMVRLPQVDLSPGASTAEFAEPGAARTWLDAERDNLTAAVYHAAKHGPPQFVWLLADALRGYFWMGSLVPEWLGVAGTAQGTARANNAPAGEAAALTSLALAHTYRGEYGESLTFYERALATARIANWPDGEVGILSNLGHIQLSRGNPDAAIVHLVESLAAAQRNGLQANIANNLAMLGYAYQLAGRLHDALQSLGEARLLFHHVGSLVGEAATIRDLAAISMISGELDTSCDLAQEALAIFTELGDRHREADALVVMANALRELGSYPQAIAAATKALDIATEFNQTANEADAHNALGSIQLQRGESHPAFEHFTTALKLSRDIGSKAQEVDALIGCAAAGSRLGRVSDALNSAEQALVIARDAGHRILEGTAHTAIAAAHLLNDEFDAAVRSAESALEIHRETGNRLGEKHALVVLDDIQHAVANRGL